MKKSIIVVLAAIGLWLPLSAQAITIPWSATLDQSQETVIVVAVPGAMGSASGTIDTITGLLSWNITWSGLSGSPFAMHFHGAAGPGVNAGVQVDIGAISGLLNPSIGTTTINAMQVADLLAGLWYINVHTEENQPGEIRGQVLIQAIREPATLALFGLALLALGIVKSRKA